MTKKLYEKRSDVEMPLVQTIILQLMLLPVRLYLGLLKIYARARQNIWSNIAAHI